MTENHQSWVWITKPDYYLDDDGNEVEALDPASKLGSDGSWWTCHADTRSGDLVLLYRTAPKSDIAYLLQATSEAKPLGSRPDDGVVTLQAFDRLVEEALEREAAEGAAPFVRQAKDRLDEAIAEAAAVGDAMRRYGWRLTDLEAARAAHEQRELELGERERREGLDAVQAEWDEWSAEDEALTLLEGYVQSLAVGSSDPVTSARENLAWEVFRMLDMPEGTILEAESQFRGRPVCRWESLYKFEVPVPLETWRADPWLSENWNALRSGFQGTQFRFEDGVWDRVLELAAAEGNPGLLEAARSARTPAGEERASSEREVQLALAKHPEALGLGDLALYSDPMNPTRTGIEYMCPDIGFIDLLLVDNEGGLVVVEIKKKRAGQAVIGQIAKYLGWVQQNLAAGRPVRGVVVSDGYDAKYKTAAPLLGLTQIELTDVKNRLGLV